MVYFSTKNRIKSFLLSSLIFIAATANAVEVHINSGNPAFPFPQFLEYSYGNSHSLGNLGTKNPEGVVHAEMEQDIRDAYQIHANEFAYSGDEWGGYKYIETPDVPGGYPHCTESVGYGLLAAAYMADAVTFNGYWMCFHDKQRNRTKRYLDCQETGTGYAYGPFSISDGASLGTVSGTTGGNNTAADGDVDVALALYVAYKQWGEFMKDPDGNIVNDACGNPISYKQEMIEVIRGLVALSTKFITENPMRVNSGLIGLDGYPKGGDTWTEQTSFVNTENPIVFSEAYPIFSLPNATNTTTSIAAGTKLYPEFQGPNTQHIDYDAPAYYREFWELFEQIQAEAGIPDFEISQFKRGEASSDWLIGDLISKNSKAIPTAGWSAVSNDGSTTEYTNFNMGEDYRCSWRTISNYMWHGNPVNTWDPKTHTANAGSNTYEYDAAVRMSEFLNDPAHWNEAAGSECIEYGDPKIPYSGPATLNIQYDPMTGITQSSFYVLNWQVGTGTFSAVSAQNYDLMGLLYRQCAIEWDLGSGSVEGDCYLGTVPHYMHGWARQLGMMVATGNYHAPSFMEPMANMKIYRAIKDSITYCYTGDQIEFILDYRNYGSVDAKDVKIVENVPADWTFVSATGGGVYNAATHTVTWNIGTVSGFKSDHLDETVGQVSYKLKAGNDASGRYCTTADITCSNGLGWTSNEYPNYTTATMQRNCVDVVARSLKIEKTVNRRLVNDGNMATYTINFENSSEAGWIDGGRPRVNVSFANGLDGSRLQLMARLWNDAIEPYINYGNYRISYYIYDAGLNCYAGGSDCTTGWGLSNEIYEGGTSIGSSEGVVVSHENIVEGKDDHGKWNQRMCIQFAPLLVTTTMHVSRYFGGAGCRIHKGGFSPMRGVWALYPSDYSSVDYTDDWSWGSTYNSEKDGLFYPVTPSWQKLDENGKSIEEPVSKWLTCGCTQADKTIPNILVEEYDGYVWRRILGTGPMAGRDVDNVEVRDTLPVGLTFGEFVNTCPLEDYGASWSTSKTADGRDIIIWSISKMQVKQKGSIIYTATANFPSGATCETEDEDIINYAWISGDKNSAINDTAKITVTCAKVPEPIIPTTLIKTADKEKYEVGDPITYTIEYEQTHGCIVEDATTSSSSDWTLNSWSLSSGTLTSGSTLTGTAMFDYTYGKNLYMEYVCAPATYATYQVLFREGSGSTIALVIKSLTTSQMEVSCYVNGSSVYAAQTIVYGGGNPFTMRLDLTDDILRMWVNKDTTTGPILSIENLPVGVGYAGFKNGGITGSDAHGAHAFSKLYVHSDYAYNLNIIDRKPEEITFVSADEGGTLKGDSIVWNLVSGKDNPILPGEKYTVTWNGTVDACNESIVNVAYAQLLGHADNEIMAQAVSECGAAECSLTEVELALDEDSICDGTIAYLTATAKPTGSYTYEFFKDGVSMGTATTTKTMPVTEEADYTVLVTSSTDATCSMESDPIKLIVSSIPTSVDYDLKTFCPGKADLTLVNMAITVAILDGNTFSWFDEDGNALTGLPDINSIKDAGAYKYEYTVLSKHKCLSDTAELIFTVGDTAIVDLGPDLTLCPGGSATLDAGAGTGYTYLWDDASTSQTLEVTAAGDYTVTVTTGSGCEATDEVTVTVASELKVDLGKDTTICSGSSLTLDAGTGYDSYAWTDGETTQTLEVTTAGTYDVSVTQGSCSGSGSIEVSVSTASAPTGTFAVSYIVGDTASDGTFDQKLTERDITVVDIETGYTYNWYDENKVLLTEEPIPAVPAGGGNATYTYYVSRTNADGCESELKEITVSVSGAPTPTVEDVYYCVGETATALTATATDDGSNTTWTLNWYDAEGTKLSTEADRTPSTATASEVTYYVSQESAVGAESGKVPVKVTTYEVGTPDTTGNQLSYCASADAIAVGLTASTTGSTTGTTQSGTLVWSVDNVTTTGTPQVNLNVAANTTTTYGVKSEYEISAGHTCSSKEVTFNVTVTYVGVPSGDMTVSYVKTEAVNGTFASLTDKNSSVATAEAGNELVWYDSDGNLIGTTAPSPESDASWASDSDVTLTYYVTQRNVATGCESEKSKVTVVISNMPMPKVSPVGYCQGETAQQLEAEKDESDGGSYDLVWYDLMGAELTSAPTPETTTPGETIYKVAQRNSSTSATSTASELKVTVYEKPVLAVTTPSAQCGGSVDLSEVITLTNAVTVTRGYYTDAAGSTAGTQLVSTSGTYYSDAYYPVINSVTGKDCRSELQNVEVEINDLSNLQISGPSTVCPGGDATLTATATSTDPGTVDYLWSDEASGTASTYEAKALTGSYGTVHTYTVTASAGACTGSEAVKESFTVTIDKGVLDGNMTIDGVSKDKTTTCGIETVALGTTHQGTDYEWYDMLGGKLGDGSSLSVTPTLTTSYELRLTNVCEARDTVTVEVKQLNVSADWTQFANEVCEGESAKVTLTITGYDSKESGSYIKWYKDNNELTQYAGQSELNFSAAEVSQSGTYHYAVSNGICEMPEIAGSDAGTLTVKAYVKYDTPATQEVVRGETAILSITNLNPSDADVTWTSSEANGTGNPYTLISADKDQLFDVTMSSTGYCSSTTQLQVLVDAKIAIAVGSDKTQICQGDAVTLKADTAGTGRILHPENYQIKWYGCDQTGNCREITGANSIQLQQQPQTTTSYYVTASYGTQKVESDKEEIEVIEPATYTKSEGTVSCSGDAVTISVQANESDAVVTWADDLTAGATREVSPTTDTDYTFTITRTGGCKQTDKLSVEVKSKPEVTTEANVSVCEGTSITLKSTVTGDEIISYVWTNASGETVSQEATATITPEMTEPYTITVGTESCGEASSTIDVNVTEVPEVGLDSLGINSRRIIVLSGGSGNFEYKMDSQDWSTEDTYEHLLYAMHVAQVKDGSGCIGSTIFSLTAPAITIPDYFSPDSNGENDVWDVANIFDIYSDATIKIYDRTGKQLVELSGDTTEWDGLYNGNKMPSTDYWYVIDIPQIDKQYTGHFTLIRR